MRDRRRLRNRLFLVGLVPSLLLLLVSGRALLLLVSQDDAMSAYRSESYAAAASSFAANRVLNPFARWIAPFDEGAARYRDEDHTGAVTAYEQALEVVPVGWECAVRNNLALAHEAIGDAAAEVASSQSTEPEDVVEARKDAEEAWTEGREVLAGCLGLVPDPADPMPDTDVEPLPDSEVTDRMRTDRRTARVIDDRLADKLTLEDLGEPAEADDPGARDETFEERRDQLDERNKRSLEERQRQEERSQDREDRRGETEESEGPPTPEW